MHLSLFKVVSLIAFALGVLALTPIVDAQTGLVYSGQTSWDPASGTVTFVTSGSMPDTKEGFFWEVPKEVKRIFIAADVTVTGGFRVLYRNVGNPLHLTGENRATSVVCGTDVEQWTVKNGVADHAKWLYSAVSVLADAEVHISNLTSRNPRGYNISGYANKAVIHVSRCDLIDSRPGDNNNSDGFIGAAGSSICDSFISTSDDGIKVYNDIVIRDVTIEHHRNGAPIQFGWGVANTVKADIHNLTIIGVDKQSRYNMAPFTWEEGNGGTRNVVIDGLKVRASGQLFDEVTRQWVPLGLFELKPAVGTLNFTATRVEISGLPPGILKTPGTISLDVTVLK